ncbi:MAG: hypothetical protein COV44_03415 [Deltaproteobacteria bacterium CG11_big_fil_rev_8_21_14_0_20_45_16]|nr:MAG: hypothetical protein COV44_03415 [Deltaproteobacteria bacterium CG11_big_fil_rev_8_21_14_0_20_45_16]
MNPVSTEEFRIWLIDQYERMELSLLQELWRLESIILDQRRDLQDLRLSLQRIEQKTGAKDEV